jgi:hypothetical protein
MFRDPDNSRVTDEEIYTILNAGVAQWNTRVLVPYSYELTWTANTKDYVLPTYIHSRMIDPQYQDVRDEWKDLGVYQILPLPGGESLLRMGGYRQDTGRIIWWGQNSISPLETPTLLANIDTDDTSLTIDDNPTVNDVGTIKLDNEWIQYAGISESNGQLTLQNLTRGRFGSTAATHDLGATVYWGLVVHRADLFQQLEHYAIARLHELFLSDGSAHEQETHERQLNWHQGQADSFWRRYAPVRSPKFVLTDGAIGHPRTTGRAFPAAGDRVSFP